MQPPDVNQQKRSKQDPPFILVFFGFCLFILVWTWPLILGLTCVYSTVDNLRILRDSLPFAVPAIIGIHFYGGRKWEKIFFVVLTVPCFVGVGYFTLYQLNVQLDTSETYITEALIVQKGLRPRTGRRGSDTVDILVGDAPDQHEISIGVSDVFHKNIRTKVGNHMRLWIRKGFLGYRWIEKYDVVEGAATQTGNTQP